MSSGNNYSLLKQPLINDWNRSTDSGPTVDVRQTLNDTILTSVNQPDRHIYSRLLQARTSCPHRHSIRMLCIGKKKDSRRTASFPNALQSSIDLTTADNRPNKRVNFRLYQICPSFITLPLHSLYIQCKRISYLQFLSYFPFAWPVVSVILLC